MYVIRLHQDAEQKIEKEKAVNFEIYQKTWVKLLKIYDNIAGINRTWQSLDSISIKSPLGGRQDWK
jgi:hypothetical protein